MTPLILAALLAQAAPPTDQDELARKATDPTASLMSLGLITGYTGDYRGSQPGLDDHSWDFKFQPVIPFKFLDMPNILRLSLPYRFSGRGEHGLGDVSVFDLALVNESWGRWGLGPVMTFAGDDDAEDKFVFGPAIGGVIQASKEFSFGAFNQNVFGPDTAVSQFQPILTWQLGDGWSLSGGDLQFTYDWHGDRWVNLPVGFQLGKVLQIGGQPLRLAVNPQYNLARHEGLEQWKVLFSVTLLLPSH